MGVRRDAIARIVGITAEYFGSAPTASVMGESPEPGNPSVQCISTHLDTNFWAGNGATYTEGVGWVDGGTPGSSIDYNLQPVNGWQSGFRPTQMIMTVVNPTETPVDEYTPFIASVIVQGGGSVLGQCDVLFTQPNQAVSIAIDLDFGLGFDISQVIISAGYYQEAPTVSCIGFTVPPAPDQVPSPTYNEDPRRGQNDWTSPDSSMAWNGSDWASVGPSGAFWNLSVAGGWADGARPQYITARLDTDAPSLGNLFTIELLGPNDEDLGQQTRQTKTIAGTSTAAQFTIKTNFSSGVDLAKVRITSSVAVSEMDLTTFILRQSAEQ